MYASVQMTSWVDGISWNISPIFLNNSLFVSATGKKYPGVVNIMDDGHLLAPGCRGCDPHQDVWRPPPRCPASGGLGECIHRTKKSSASHRKQKKGRKEVKEVLSRLSIVGIWVLFLGGREVAATSCVWINHVWGWATCHIHGLPIKGHKVSTI